jgi:glutathione S-transferase
MLTLYYAPGTCARAAHIALEEAGAEFRAERVDFAKNAQRSPEYLRINPKGRVPALVTEDGILTEAPAILAYIAMRFPAAGLMPLGDPFAFARVQAFNAYLCATVHVAHAHRGRGSRWVDDPAAIEAMKAKVTQNMGECFDLIERDMIAGPWAMGGTYSVADPYLFTISAWLAGDGVDIARFPKVAAQRERMLGRPAVQRALAREETARAA